MFIPSCKVKNSKERIAVQHHRFGKSHAAWDPAEVIFTPSAQQKLVLDLATQEGCKAELTWVTSQDSLPTKEQLRVLEISRQCHGRESNGRTHDSESQVFLQVNE